MAAYNSQADEEIIDLTELIETGDSNAKSVGPKAYASAAAGVSADSGGDDFEDLLSSAVGKSGSSESSHPFDADEQLDMSGMGDIDNLLESLDIPVQPESGPAAAETPAKPAPAPAPPAAKKEAPAAESSFADLDSVLDDLLGDPLESSETGRQASPAEEAPVNEPVASHEENLSELDSDLDSILMEADQMSPDMATSSQNQEPELSETFAPDQLPDAPEKQEMRRPTVKETADFLDDMVGVPKAPEETSSMPRAALKIRKEQDAPPVSDVLSVQPSQSNYSPELIAGICGNVLTSQANATQESLRDFSHRLGAQSAHLEELARQVEDLGKRLRASEAKLSAAKARIIALEKNQERLSGLEDLLREGTSLHTGFMTMLSGAVAQAVSAAMPAKDESLDLRESLLALEKRDNALDARLDNMEKRLDSLEPKFNENIENAAARAVVKILHEEIGKLAAEGGL